MQTKKKKKYIYIYIYIYIYNSFAYAEIKDGSLVRYLTGVKSAWFSIYVSSHTDEMWYNKSLSEDDSVYIYIYIYIYALVMGIKLGLT